MYGRLHVGVTSTFLPAILSKEAVSHTMTFFKALRFGWGREGVTVTVGGGVAAVVGVVVVVDEEGGGAVVSRFSIKSRIHVVSSTPGVVHSISLASLIFWSLSLTSLV